MRHPVFAIKPIKEVFLHITTYMIWEKRLKMPENLLRDRMIPYFY